MGDDIRLCLNDRTLVLVNHQSTADVPMLMTNFNSKASVLPNVMWIMDRIFKFTNFGIVSIIHQDFFILSVSIFIIIIIIIFAKKFLYMYIKMFIGQRSKRTSCQRITDSYPQFILASPAKINYIISRRWIFKKKKRS